MMCSIGERIKEQRKKLGMTQPQIKEITGISSGTLSDIENGKALPATPSLIKLSQALNCTIDYILTGKTSTSEIYAISDKREIELLDGFRELSEDNKNELIGIMLLKLQNTPKDKNVHVKSSHLINTDNGTMAI